jgi:general secretion pathway protein K
MRYNSQRGVAIITALLIVAIATTVSINISTRLQLDVRRTANLLTADQAWQYTLAAESWSRRILQDDRKKSSIDDYSENWAIELPPLPVEGGWIRGKLTDLQGCFNLNSLVPGGAINALEVERFRRMLVNLQLRPELADAVIDWLDTDVQTTIPDGAEDGYYMNLERPYRSANSAMFSPSELRLVRGFEDTAVYNKLLPHVCAFGVATPININTATAEVLRSLANNLTESDAAAIIAQRNEKAFADINAFLSFNNLKDTIKKTDGLSVSSDYFMLETESKIGQVQVRMYSVIQRDDIGRTTVLARTQGVY